MLPHVSALEQRPLGRNGDSVACVGLGCMGMSEFYGPGDDDASVRVIHAYLQRGNFLDTADMYGVGRNEELVGRAVREGGYYSGHKRQEVVVATKFGNVRGPKGEFLGVSGRPEYVRSACEASMKRLGIDVIDLYYQHRVDPNVPIEDTVGAMKELVTAGKVKLLGLSEAGPATIRKAAAIHPIAALQTEYSLWYREPEADLLPLCRELGITFVAYSPLGRGLLTGKYASAEDLEAGDYRKNSPRFQGENYDKNMALVKQVEAVAEKNKCSASQVALAWILETQPDVVPIPGTKKLTYLESNMAAADVQIAPADLRTLSDVFAVGSGAGLRYQAEQMGRVGI